jgi:hypothetical protein
LYKKSSKKALGGSGEKSPKNVPKKQKADFRFLLFLDFFFAVFPARRNSLKMYLPEAPGNRPNGVSWDKGPRRTPPLAICTIQFVLYTPMCKRWPDMVVVLVVAAAVVAVVVVVVIVIAAAAVAVVVVVVVDGVVVVGVVVAVVVLATVAVVGVMCVVGW